MSSFTRPIAMSAPIMRSVAIAALMGATMLATPLSTARAEQAAVVTGQAAAAATETKGETVEQRVTNLHAALKITPEQDAQWNAVAQAMRENAANMDKLVAAKRTTPPQNMSAVDDLKSYQAFAQACRRAEEPDLIVREAVRRDARRPEEGGRRRVQYLARRDPCVARLN
jgi:hypothetical protein